MIKKIILGFVIVIILGVVGLLGFYIYFMNINKVVVHENGEESWYYTPYYIVETEEKDDKLYVFIVLGYEAPFSFRYWRFSEYWWEALIFGVLEFEDEKLNDFVVYLQTSKDDKLSGSVISAQLEEDKIRDICIEFQQSKYCLNQIDLKKAGTGEVEEQYLMMKEEEE